VKDERYMICDKCHAGQMVEYSRKISPKTAAEITIMGSKCDRCGYIKLDSDDDIWSAVGL
jgi:hypothetical protein